MIVIYIRVGCRQFHKGVEIYEPLNELEVVFVGICLHRKIEFVENAGSTFAIFIYMNLLM